MPLRAALERRVRRLRADAETGGLARSITTMLDAFGLFILVGPGAALSGAVINWDAHKAFSPLIAEASQNHLSVALSGALSIAIQLSMKCSHPWASTFHVPSLRTRVMRIPASV
jgi:hypothetical protein